MFVFELDRLRLQKIADDISGPGQYTPEEDVLKAIQDREELSSGAFEAWLQEMVVKGWVERKVIKNTPHVTLGRDALKIDNLNTSYFF
jgi:hypothetical protein